MMNSTQRKVPHYKGEVPGCHVGQTWEKRMDMFQDGMHKQVQAGIDGRPESGCFSIVLSAGYEDDEDNGDEIVYTGCGGFDEKKVQFKDQEFTGRNASLVTSCNKKFPVRVIRGSNCPSPYAPAAGYRYDGLYLVTEYWVEKKRGFNICRFRMKRIPDQPAVEKREDYTPGAKRVKRPTAPPKPRITACLRGDMGYLCVSIDALIQRATQDGVCVVCDCVVPVGDVAGFAAHVEGHVEELWNSLENVEKEKLAIRGVINAERIESTIDSLLSDESITIVNSPVFVWP